MKDICKFIFLVILIIQAVSCKKYLTEKPDKSLVVPESIEDLQALLDNNSYMNEDDPSIGETSSDNYFLTLDDYNSISTNEQNVYLWGTAIYTQFPNDWALNYQPVYFSNIVLDNIDKIARTTQNANAWDNLKGSALMFRAKSFLTGVWNWSVAYDKVTATKNVGIPLRLNADFNATSTRASVEDCYRQIISDLQSATLLLPKTPIHPIRPSRPAAFALLARAYLAKSEYDSCLKYSSMCLEIKNKLIDYNSFNPTDIFPIPQFNDEVIFHTKMGSPYYNLLVGCADTTLYNSYAADDLRKTIFFNSNGAGYYTFKGSYDNFLFPFSGIATDEMYLMRAECYARTGNTNAALTDLNTLLVKRWKAGTFVPFTASSSSEALNTILTERRKELIWRDLRWMDIKRLNKQGANITLTRSINNQAITLKPNDNRFALPLPADIITLTGMEQNPR